MKVKNYFAAAALALAVAGPLYAQDPVPAATQQQDPADEIRALRARLDQLEAQQRETARKVQESKTVEQVLKEADRNSMLIDMTGASAGWDDKKQQLFIGSADGSTYVHPGIIFQGRYVANWREKSGTAGKDTTQDGFEITRFKPYIDGNVFSKDLTFKAQWATQKGVKTSNPDPGSLILDDAWVGYTFAHDVLLGGNLGFRGGQFKNPVVHEETTGDQYQLAADRSLVNGLIGGGALGPRTQGFELLLTGEKTPLHAEMLYHDGSGGSVNTDFRNERPVTKAYSTLPAPVPANTTTINWGAAGRVECKIMGDWKDYRDFSAKGDANNLLVVGGGLDVTDMAKAFVYRYSADAQLELGGKFSLYAAFIGDYTKGRNGGAATHNYGGLVQAGYLITPALEVFARYDLTYMDRALVAVDDPRHFHEITAGINWFFGPEGSWGHHAQVTVDVTYLPNGSPKDFNDGNVLSQTSKRDELILRTQLQLAI